MIGASSHVENDAKERLFAAAVDDGIIELPMTPETFFCSQQISRGVSGYCAAFYRLFYQRTRIIRDKGGLKHDDRLETRTSRRPI